MSLPLVEQPTLEAQVYRPKGWHKCTKCGVISPRVVEVTTKKLGKHFACCRKDHVWCKALRTNKENKP